MLGFRGFGRKQDSSTPAARQSVMLVSKEDIYRPPVRFGQRDAEPVLLLKKGHAVDADELPRYIKNGAHPSQFQLRVQDEPVTPPQIKPHDFERRQAMSNPILQNGAAQRLTRSRMNVLVLEPDQKSLKRLIDCLFVCGVNLDRIHPVRVPEHLAWAVDKHQPDLLIVDYHLHNSRNGLALLQSLPRGGNALHTVLTLAPQPELAPLEEKLVRKLCADKGVHILPKPVTRFALNEILESQ